MKQPNLPASGGVSDLSNGATVAPPIRGAKRQAGEDVIRNLEGARRVDGTLPAGATASRRDVIEVPMNKVKRAKRHHAEYLSADGETYSFRTHDARGKTVPGRELMCLFLAMREHELGGSARAVFEAFRVEFPDSEGKPVFPIPYPTSAPKDVEETVVSVVGIFADDEE